MRRILVGSVMAAAMLALIVPSGWAVVVDETFQLADSECSATVETVKRDYHPRYRKLAIRIGMACTGDDADVFDFGVVNAGAMNRGDKEMDVSLGGSNTMVVQCNHRDTAKDDWARVVRPVWIDVFAQVVDVDGSDRHPVVIARTADLAFSC